MTKPEHSHLFLIPQATIHVIDEETHTQRQSKYNTHTDTYTNSK